MSVFIRSCPTTFALASFGPMLLWHEAHSENFVSKPPPIQISIQSTQYIQV